MVNYSRAGSLDVPRCLDGDDATDALSIVLPLTFLCPFSQPRTSLALYLPTAEGKTGSIW